MSCGLPHVELDAAIASVRKVLKLAIENEQFPEKELDRLWDTYQSLKAIKKKIDHKDVTFVPDDRFSDVISFTSEI
jgi:hypothetical protein|tara:strand:+ start:1116 stop:1343 length:228 start_codon:yes stop_codon:yes gene_type:complete